MTDVLCDTNTTQSFLAQLVDEITSARTEFEPDRIGQLMRENGLSPRAFAKQVGVSRAAVSMWLNRVVQPQIGTLTRICQEFDVPIQYFFTGQDGGQADD